MATLIPVPELMNLYASGWFPMADACGRIMLHSPDPRGILPLDGFRVPHGTKRCLGDPGWQIRVDTAFRDVLEGCAQRRETWIDATIGHSCLALHDSGFAHSVEVWRNGRLAGGLYGVRLGGVFFGESMFHTVSGASKVALAALVGILRSGGFSLLDIQWVTPHLELFGATAIPREDYLRRLALARSQPAQWPPRGEVRTPEAIPKPAQSQKPGRSPGRS